MRAADSIAPVRQHRFRLVQTDAIFAGAALRTTLLSASQVLPRVSCVSCPASTSVLADRPKQRQQLRLVLSAVFVRSLCEPFVSQSLARYAVNEAIEACQGVVLDVALIEPKGELVNVTAKVLFARVMVDADQAALHDREHGLDAVRGHVVANELASAVVDRFMFEGLGGDSAVSKRLVRIEFPCPYWQSAWR